MTQKKYYYLMTFFYSMGIMGMQSQMPYFAREHFAATPTQLALVPIVLGLSYIILAPLMGWIGSRIGSKYLLTAGCLSVFLVSLLLAFSKNMYWVYGYAFALSFSLALFYPNMIGLMGQSDTIRAINRQIGMFNLGWVTPTLLSAVLAGYLLDALIKISKPTLTFPIVSLLAFVGAGISIKIHRLHNVPPKQEKPQQIQLRPEDQALLPAGGMLLLLLAWFSVITVRGSMSIIFTLFPAHARELGFSAASVGWLLAVGGTAQALVFYGISRMESWHFRQFPFYLAAVAMILGLGLLSITERFLILVATFIVLGFGAAISYHLSIFYSLVVSKNKNRAGGMHESMLTVGNVIAIFCAGQYEELVGNRSGAYYVGIVFSLIFLIVTILVSGILMRSIARKETAIP